MTILKTSSSEIAHWHELVLDAQKQTGVYLSEPVENYMVLTLGAYMTKNSLASILIAIEFLESLADNSHHNLQKLRDVGDHCLILSGLFPERIKKKNLTNDYLINIGKEAYHTLAYAPVQWHLNQELFYQLFTHFNDMKQLLRSVRNI